MNSLEELTAAMDAESATDRRRHCLVVAFSRLRKPTLSMVKPQQVPTLEISPPDRWTNTSGVSLLSCATVRHPRSHTRPLRARCFVSSCARHVPSFLDNQLERAR
ncbi:hypothetical protein BASA62_007391 [Batrachochytrium salamandrivorans]|nr:hypothetical protein BASA62_007391 [Batrachochytrium salamandrivorans]